MDGQHLPASRERRTGNVPEQERLALLRRLQAVEAENAREKRRLLALRSENEELRSLQGVVEILDPEKNLNRSLREEAAQARVDRLRQENAELEARLRIAKEALARNQRE